MEDDLSTQSFFGAVWGFFLGALLGFLFCAVFFEDSSLLASTLPGAGLGALAGAVFPKPFSMVGKALAWLGLAILSVCNP